MLTKDDFIRHILGEAPRTKAGPTKKDTGHIDGFDFADDTPDSEVAEDTRFVTPLLQAGFGEGRGIPRATVIRGADAVAKRIPDEVRYWPKTPIRPHHTLLIEANLTHRELLDIRAFKSEPLAHLDIAEDAVARLVAEALEGFQRGADGLDASAPKGQKHETLCVVSIIDEREGHAGRLACFGTFNAKTEGLETFFLTEHARTWDRADARERLGLIYDRQFKKLGEASWQEAFTTTDERKQAEKLLEVCTKKNVVEKDVQESILDLLDTIARGFGLRKKADAERRLRAFPLPGEHDIGIDSEERENKYGGTNPFSGVTLRDDHSRLLGYIVYPLKTKSDAEKLGQHLKKHNRFHNVLVVYPDANQASIELWQGREQLTGKLRKGQSHKDAADVVNLLSRFFVVSKAKVRNPAELAQELAYRARYLRRLALKELEDEPEKGPLRNLYNAFKVALVHDQKEDEFADAFAQTITYGLLTARWLGNDQLVTGGERFTRQSALKYLPAASPFLNELFKSALSLKLDEQRGRLLWLVDDVADLLDRIDVTYVFGAGDKGSDAATDPVIHFYEPFLAAYDKDLKNKRGVFFTPRPVVSYIVRTVHEMLQKEFGLEDGLASTDTWADVAKRVDGLKLPEGTKASDAFVRVLDPATGTGTFIYECIGVIEETMKNRWSRELKVDSWADEKVVARWNEYVPKHLLPRLYGFELMMASYAICHLKLSFKLRETGYHFGRHDRLGVHLTNTLDEPSASANPKLAGLFVTLAEEAREVDSVKRSMRFTVLIGNPPYSGLSANMTGYAQRLVDGYKFVDGAALNERKSWLQDDYVKFFRIAQLAVEASGVGILGFITNHGYIDNPTFRGMRQSLTVTFSSSICVIDLHGNANKKERSPDGSEDKNVFDIRQGVAVFFGSRAGTGKLGVLHQEVWGSRESKYAWLADAKNAVSRASWVKLAPDSPFYLFEPVLGAADLRAEYEAGWRVNDIFPLNSAGFITARDHFVVEFDRAALLDRISDFANPKLSDDAIRKKYFTGRGSDKYPEGDSRGWKLPEARKRVRADKQWGERAIECLYRPFDIRSIYWAEWMVDWPRPDVMRHLLARNSLALSTSRSVEIDRFEHVWCADLPLGHHTVTAKEVNYVFPLFLAPDDAGGELRFRTKREANLAPGFVKALTSSLGLELTGDRSLPRGIEAEDIFGYIYAILHSPSFRTRYVEYLRNDFPRIPLCSHELFVVLAAKGRELVSHHLLKGDYAEKSLPRVLGATDTVVEKAAFSEGKLWFNRKKTSGIDGVTEAVWSFRVGGYQICDKWLKDRKGRPLSKAEVAHYRRIVRAIAETLRLTQEVDEEITKHGGWPAAFATKASVS